jgi:hypothetical protein
MQGFASFSWGMELHPSKHCWWNRTATSKVGVTLLQGTVWSSVYPRHLTLPHTWLFYWPTTTSLTVTLVNHSTFTCHNINKVSQDYSLNAKLQHISQWQRSQLKPVHMWQKYWAKISHLKPSTWWNWYNVIEAQVLATHPRGQTD